MPTNKNPIAMTAKQSGNVVLYDPSHCPTSEARRHHGWCKTIPYDELFAAGGENVGP
jgi:hypothetical protein